MKLLFTLSISVFILSSCHQPNDDPRKEATFSQSENMEPISELSITQQAAFDAFNELQVSTDRKNRLYSTFAGVEQPCYPPDTNLRISQTELLLAMKAFVSENCKNLSTDKRDELAATSVLAQKEYTLSLCLGNSANTTYENGAPMAGTWVISSVLNRRDIIIVW